MTRIALVLPLVLAAACAPAGRPAPQSAEAPLAAVLRGPAGETVLRGQVRRNPDGSAQLTAVTTRGAACQGLFLAGGEGVITCDGAEPVRLDVPPALYAEPSGQGLVRAGNSLVALGWGSGAEVPALRALF
jgi:hypothetical protein